ncbi:SpoIIE family protein phosphatase [Actinotalea ferrariae]|uniref:ATP-binding SpoIIE family protein phosphatase n=1 Tax=Actinotalea ferrariae TaxID=1386098 RepID=UPI001C8B1AD7|nr:ATP-binding SpoIIE family protein phosphatase [Actinotalea ferrariae]MBX9244796.1 SpoIIE family protein phosphatase [Actinotalea ferrariae]
MVNRRPPAPPNDLLADVRDRALRDTDVSFVITDATAPDTPIVWVNDAFTRTTGYAVEEVLGRNPNLLHGPGTDLEQAGRMADAVAAGRASTVTVLNYRRDGTPFWNQVSISPVLDDAGAVTHWVGVQVDVTRQVREAETQRRSIEVERRARSGLALVSQVSDLLNDLDDPYVLREIASLLRAQVVEWASFFVADADLRPANGIDPTFRESGTTHRHRPVDTVDGLPPADPVQALLDGTDAGPIDLRLDVEPSGPTTTWLVAHLRVALGGRPDAPRGVVVHTVPGRRRSQGLLVTVPHGGGGLATLDENDLTVLHLVVRRVGMAIDNVRLYAREHRLAETLQRAMLPEQAEVKGLDVWTYYAPSSGHAQVGGDWYDVLQLSSEQVALVIGDVVGHDVEAAAAMGQLRSVVRSYAFDAGTPGSVLDRVDQLVAGMRIARSASLVLATLERRAPDDDGAGEEGRWTMRYSRAGHLPPLLARDGEVVQLADAAGAMVGFGVTARATGEVELRPGDVVVLYTDGLIERRDRTLRDGLAALVEATSRVGATDAAGVGEELLARLADGPEDDVAVVVVRVPEPAGAVPGGPVGGSETAPRRRRWSMPSEAASIARARHAVARTCAAWGLPGVKSAELVVSELVANAVLHGWGHVVLRLFDTGEGLRIEVEDSNPAPPVATDGHHGRVGGYGMQIVERLADWGWRPSGAGKLVWARVRPSPFGEPRPTAGPTDAGAETSEQPSVRTDA